MSHLTPVPAAAVREIKWLAKRFSKRLQAQTAHRIKGQALYAAFVNPLGYDTFNQLQHQAKRSGQSSFDYDTYFGLLKRELRKHLPVLLDGDLIDSLLDAVYVTGIIFLKIDGTRTAPETTQLIINHPAYRGFLSEYRDTYGDLAHLLELVAPSTPLLASSEPSTFKITFDVSGWNNEGDPFATMVAYEPFLHLITNLKSEGIDVSVVRADQTRRIEEFVNIEPNGKEHWDHLHQIDFERIFARSVPYRACVDCDEDPYDHCSRKTAECSNAFSDHEAKSIVANSNGRLILLRNSEDEGSCARLMQSNSGPDDRDRSSQNLDAELERAKARMQKHRSALSERLRFTLSVPALDDRGVIVGHKRKVKA
jgi:hypothetical protein